jgi:hypothetical protein
MQDLIDYLTRQKFFAFSTPKIASMLRDANALHHATNLRGRCTNHWSLVEFKRSKESLPVPENIKGPGDPF